MDYDGLEDDLAASFGDDNQEEIAPEDILQMVMINRNKKTKVSISLEDDEGDEVDLVDTISGLIKYVEDKLKDKDENQFVEQILPLMSQSVVTGLSRMIGTEATAFHLTNPITRTAIINMMAVGFLLLKFVQENSLSVVTHEEPVSDEEIVEIEQRSKVASAAMALASTGMDPKQVLQILKEQGKITDEDLKKALGESTDDPDDKDDED